jgi:hypothetical protein
MQQAIDRVRRYAGAMLEDAGLPQLGSILGHEDARSSQPSMPRVRSRRVRKRPAGVAALKAPAGAAGAATANGNGTYDYVGIVMAKSAEGDAVAEILGRRDEIEVIEQPAFWDIRAKDRLAIPYAEVSDQLGYEIDAYSIQHEMSTHYGRMVAADDALMLFSDPTEAMQYLMT